jgi:hypothetical protein
VLDLRFLDLPSLLPPSTLLVLNESRVITALLPMAKDGTGGKAEVCVCVRARARVCVCASVCVCNPAALRYGHVKLSTTPPPPHPFLHKWKVLCVSPVAPSPDPALALQARSGEAVWRCMVGGKKIRAGSRLRAKTTLPGSGHKVRWVGRALTSLPCAWWRKHSGARATVCTHVYDTPVCACAWPLSWS